MAAAGPLEHQHATVKGQGQDEEEHDEELLQAHAGHVDAQTDAQGALAGTGVDHVDANALDDEGDDVEPDEDGGERGRFDAKDLPLRQKEPDHAAEDHVDEGVDP